MKRIIICIVSLICICSCQKNSNTDSYDKLSVFVGFMPIYCNDYQIFLHINDSLIFSKHIPSTQLGGEYILMSKVNKTDSIMKFRMQINENDTSFYYYVADIDSLLLGLYYKTIEVDSLFLPTKDRFFIFDENYPYAWLFE